MEWEKTLGSTGWGHHDRGRSVQQTTDGGYILVGWTSISGVEDGDVYLIKTDPDGNELWSNTFGGNNYDAGFSVQQAFDDGFIIAGYTSSFSSNGDQRNGYLIKTDSDRNEIWSKILGGEDHDAASSVQQTLDGGYVITGFTASSVYLVKTDTEGNEQWSTTFGGREAESRDSGSSVQQTTDGGYIIAGTKSLYSGEDDVYLIYYKPGDYVNNHVTFEPDPSTYLFNPDSTDCQAGAVGKFSFNATLANTSVKVLSKMSVQIDELTNDNLCLTNAGLIGEGQLFEVPEIDDYADGYLSPEEYVDVPFTVCLKNKKPFRFFVNVAGVDAD